MERLIRIGQLAPQPASPLSRLGIGLEKLDRNVFDPRPAYDALKGLGVYHVRLQSGWQRTEQRKGVYDFSWLDEIVDALIVRGMAPWLCLCYGNPLYSPAAARYFGAVGVPPIFTEEEKEGWRRYVAALTKHFRGRVRWYEIWNEPDGQWCWKHGVSAREYALFANDTADAVHQADPEAKAITGALSRISLPYFAELFENGVGSHADAVSFHRYQADETRALADLRALRALIDAYCPQMRIIQGESGTQSDSRGAGALSGGAWTEEKQAKYLLRHRLLDLSSEVAFTSHFTAVDMVEALNGDAGNRSTYMDYGYFGVLHADFDENGFACGTYTPKKSYTAMQSLCAVFRGDETPAELPLRPVTLPSPRFFGRDDGCARLLSAGFARPDGSAAWAYWKACDLLRETYSGTVSLELAPERRPIRLIDLMDGSVYALPETMIKKQGDAAVCLVNLPLLDHPLLLTFGGFAPAIREAAHG